MRMLSNNLDPDAVAIGDLITATQVDMGNIVTSLPLHIISIIMLRQICKAQEPKPATVAMEATMPMNY